MVGLNRVKEIDNYITVQNVLISVYDKRNLEILVHGLLKINPEVTIYSTGGTYTRILDFLGPDGTGAVQPVSSYTGQPEMQGGLVKTLDFKIYLGLLSETYNPHHQEDLRGVNGVSIDMVVVNLYPFAQTVAQQDVTLEDARTHIDIGGPCMLRASAKNFLRVVSMCNPDDYPSVLKEMEESTGSVSLRTRYNLAVQSFNHTAKYDQAIAEYLNSSNFGECRKIYTYCDG